MFNDMFLCLNFKNGYKWVSFCSTPPWEPRFLFLDPKTSPHWDAQTCHMVLSSLIHAELSCVKIPQSIRTTASGSMTLATRYENKSWCLRVSSDGYWSQAFAFDLPDLSLLGINQPTGLPLSSLHVVCAPDCSMRQHDSTKCNAHLLQNPLDGPDHSRSIL